MIRANIWKGLFTVEQNIFQTYLIGIPIQLETAFLNLILIYNFSPSLGVEIQHIWKAAA